MDKVPEGQVPSPVIHRLFESLELPATVAGQLDWVAGMYRINRTIGEWEAYFEDPAADLDLSITLTHEMHHFMQVSSLSYMHRFALLLYWAVAAEVQTCYNDLSKLPATLKDQHNIVRDTVWDLNWREPEGISVMDIIESLTYFVEVNTARPRRTTAFAAELTAAIELPDEYKRAYLHAFELSEGNGNMAAIFELMCHLSLCSGKPRECFSMLARSLATGDVVVDDTMSVGDVIAFCRANDPDHWGFAWEWKEQFDSGVPSHPVFSTLEPAIQDADMYLNFLKYIASPHKFFEPFTKLALEPPILFNGHPTATFPGFGEWPMEVGRAMHGASTEKKRKHGLWVLYVASASRKYLNVIGVPPSNVRPAT